MTQTYIGCVERTEIWDECASDSQMYAHKHTIVDCRSLSLSLTLLLSLHHSRRTYANGNSLWQRLVATQREAKRDATIDHAALVQRAIDKSNLTSGVLLIEFREDG